MAFLGRARDSLLECAGALPGSLALPGRALWGCPGSRQTGAGGHVSRLRAAQYGLIMAMRRRACGMAKDVRVSATLHGDHSLGLKGVKGACGAIERALLDGTTEYAVQSIVPGSAFTRHGGRGGSGLVAVRLDGSSFEVVWDDESSFDAPYATLGAVGKCLGNTGEVNVRVNAVVSDVAMDPLRIEGGSLTARFDSATFELEPPMGSGRDEDEIAFSGMTARTEDAMIMLAIFGERKSEMSVVPGILERAMGALSGYCEALAK